MYWRTASLPTNSPGNHLAFMSYAMDEKGLASTDKAVGRPTYNDVRAIFVELDVTEILIRIFI